MASGIAPPSDGTKTANQTALSLRDEIETIIKREKIDRNRFQEFSKFRYSDIIRKFYYSFSGSHASSAAVCLRRKELPFQKNLTCFAVAGIYAAKSWADYMDTLKSSLPFSEDKRFFLILQTGWVYEGYADETFQVLSKCDVWIGDFFIVSSKFDWVLAYDSIDMCAFLYQK